MANRVLCRSNENSLLIIWKHFLMTAVINDHCNNHHYERQSSVLCYGWFPYMVIATVAMI